MSKQVSASSSGREIAPPHGSEHDCDAVSGERSSFSASTGGTTDSKYAYKDFSRVLPDDGEAVLDAIVNVGPSNVKHQKLPVKLDAMLSDPEFSHIISWMPHGRSWRILKPKTFVKEVLPKYFDYCNYNSFIRLVNAWGFRRFTSGPDRHSYYHELFLRGLSHLHNRMRRVTGKEKKTPIDQDDEPDLYRISQVFPLPPTGGSHASADPYPTTNLLSGPDSSSMNAVAISNALSASHRLGIPGSTFSFQASSAAAKSKHNAGKKTPPDLPDAIASLQSGAHWSSLLESLGGAQSNNQWSAAVLNLAALSQAQAQVQQAHQQQQHHQQMQQAQQLLNQHFAAQQHLFQQYALSAAASANSQSLPPGGHSSAASGSVFPHHPTSPQPIAPPGAPGSDISVMYIPVYTKTQRSTSGGTSGSSQAGSVVYAQNSVPSASTLGVQAKNSASSSSAQAVGSGQSASYNPISNPPPSADAGNSSSSSATAKVTAAAANIQQFLLR